jgi:uncharacterized protein YndB with AHSA1/START domain
MSTTDEYVEATQPPGPDPALKRLERFVGTWAIKGRTRDADHDNVFGKTSFEWLPGGFFLQQCMELDFMGLGVRGLEVIGYDPSTGTFPSTLYSNLTGVPITYTYDVQGDRVTIRTELAGGATYTGTFSDDGDTGSGGWRPDEGMEGPGNVAYDITATRVRSQSHVVEGGKDMTDRGSNKRDLTVARVFDAPVELVWRAWSDPEHVMRWWGPEGFTSPTCRMDFRVGGTTIVHMYSPAFGDLYNTWEYREILPLRRIEFVQNFADEHGAKVDPVEIGLPPATREAQDVRSVVAFEAMGDKTEMTVTEYGYTTDQAYEMSKLGLEQCLDKMAASFAGA